MFSGIINSRCTFLSWSNNNNNAEKKIYIRNSTWKWNTIEMMMRHGTGAI